MEKHYIKAVVSLVLQGRDIDAVLSNLKTVLARKGHEKLYVQVLKGVQSELSLQKNTLASSVVIAKEADLPGLQNELSESLQKLGGNPDETKITVDPTLIGGFIVSHNGKLINRSYKEKLVSLYRSITK